MRKLSSMGTPLNTHYDIWMIGMAEHPISMMYIRSVLPSWKDYDVKPFDAVTPKDLPTKTKIDWGHRKRPLTATEKAVWYSHFELWCKCVNTNKPIVIIEHDSKLVKPLPDLSKEGHKFLSFINRDYGNKQGIHCAPGSGYYITPLAAQRLISTAVSKPQIINSDGHLGWKLNVLKQERIGDYKYIEQINFDGYNTIDHKNVNRKFVGPDYENFDLSGIHGQEI